VEFQSKNENIYSFSIGGSLIYLFKTINKKAKGSSWQNKKKYANRHGIIANIKYIPSKNK